MTLIPLRSDVLIYPIDDPEKTKGGIYIPDAYRLRRKIDQGFVIALGPECTDGLDLGDRVLFGAYSGDKVTIESGEIRYLVPEDFIVAKLSSEEPLVIIDTQTMKRLLTEELGKLHSRDFNSDELERIEEALIFRIDNLTQSEGFE